MLVGDLSLMDLLYCAETAPWGLRALHAGWQYRVVRAVSEGTRPLSLPIRVAGPRRGRKWRWRGVERGTDRAPKLRRVRVRFEGRQYMAQLLDVWGEPVVLVLRPWGREGLPGRPAKDAILVVGERQPLNRVLRRAS